MSEHFPCMKNNNLTKYFGCSVCKIQKANKFDYIFIESKQSQNGDAKFMESADAIKKRRCH